MFYISLLSILKFCHQYFANILIRSQVISEKPVFGGNIEFLRPNRKQTFRTFIFYKSLLSILKICHQYFANISISSQVIGENSVFGGHFVYLRPYRKQNFRTYIFYKSLPSIFKICHQYFENISISSQVIGEKPVFGSHF